MKAVSSLCVVLFMTLMAAAPVPAFAGDTVTVLTYNVFDAFFGPDRVERMEALPEAIMALDPVPEVIVFEEAFKKEHRDMVVDELIKLGYPVKAVHYEKIIYGTGIMLISAFELEKVEYTPFRVDGDWFDPEHYSGKGIFHYLLKTQDGPLDVYGTHPIARFKPLYDKDGRHRDRDRRTIDRLIEMEMICRTVMEQNLPSARSVILTGDMNASPDMWSYQYLLQRGGFEDSFAACNPGKAESTYCPTNTMVEGDFSRIDHIFYRNMPGDNGFWLVPLQSRVVMKEPIELSDGRMVSLSDHYGVLTEFEIITSEQELESMSPEMTPSGPATTERSRSDLTSEGIVLNPDNYLAWQNWAVDAIYKAGIRYNRLSPRVIPAARVMIAGEVEDKVVVPLNTIEKFAIRSSLKDN